MAKGLKEVFESRKQILEGIANSIFKKEHVEKIAEKRMDICNKCPHIDKEGSKCFVPGTQPCCGLCGCKLAWKTRALSEGCDDHRWEMILTPEEEVEVNKTLGITNQN